MRGREISAVFMSLLIVLATVAFANALSLTFDPGAVQPSDSEALIRWQSDQLSNSAVYYSDNSSNLTLSERNSTFTFNHSVLLRNLNVSTAYFYKIESTNQNGTVELNNSDTFYSFTTVPDTTPPFINVTIPIFYNSARLTLEGTTEPRALVHAYANPQPGQVGIVYYDRETFADTDGNFVIADLPLDANLDTNTVVIWARDRAGNVNITSGTVTIDTTPPNVTLTIPAATHTGSLQINGTTDENITLLVYAAGYNGTTAPEINDSNLLKNETVVVHSITPFTTAISLQAPRNLVRVIAIDRAGNAVIAEQAVLFDSVPPSFESPVDLSIFDPSYTLDFNVEGKISEKGQVTSIVNGHRGDTVDTDDSGNFKINVQLRKELISQINASSHATVSTAAFVNGTIIDEWKNLVTLEAKDESGLTANLTGAVRYTLCGVGTWWNVERPAPTPDILSPALLLDGNAQLAFNYKLTWQGMGEEGKISRVSLEKAPLNKEYADFYDEEWVTEPVTTTSQDKKTGYSVMHLSAPDPTPPGLNWSYNEKLRNISLHRATSSGPTQVLTPGYSCRIPGFGCVKIPLMIKIEFNSPMYNGTQKQCWTTETAIDASMFIVNFIPSQFLNATVELLGTAIDLINMTLAPIRDVAKITTYVCIGTIALQFVYYFRELFTCKVSSAIPGGGFDINNAKQQNPADTSDSGPCGDDQKCKACSKTIDARIKFEEKQAWVCDRIFMPAAPTLQEYARTSTKESYCYGSTTGSTTSNFFIDTFNKARGAYTTPGSNLVSADVLGQTEKCPRLHLYAKPGDTANVDCCGVEYKRKWNSACVFMDELKESACLQNQANVGAQPAGAGQTGASADLNCHPLWNSAAGFCERQGGASPDYVSTTWEFKDSVMNSASSADPSQSPKCSDLYTCNGVGCPLGWGGTVINNNNVNVCLYRNGALPTGDYCTNPNSDTAYCDYKETSSAQTVNLCLRSCQERNVQNIQCPTKTCTITKLSSASQIRQSPVMFRIVPHSISPGTLRVEGGFAVHVGFVGDSTRFPTTAPGITGNTGNSLTAYFGGANSPIQRDTEFIVWPKPEQNSQLSSMIGDVDCTTCTAGAVSGSGCDKYKQFGDKIKEIAKPVRNFDTDICRVYNEIRSKMGQVNQKYIVDPANAGLLRSFQCIALPSMISHLSFWKIVLTVIRNCFVNIMTTGEGSPTVCREVLSIYICDMIYNAIKCFANKYSMSYGRQGGIGGIGNVLGALTGSGSGVAGSLNQRYGSSAMFQSIFNERRLVHAVCLFAFTGDWVFDIESLFDADFPVPINSTVFIEPRERRFISANSLSTPSGLTTQNYKIGVAMIAGADLTFSVKLICSDDYSCSPVNGFAGGRCDCVGDVRRVMAFPLRTVSNSLSAGEGLGPGGRGVVEYNQFESRWRFDKVQVTWTYRDSHGNQVNASSAPLDIHEAGGRPPAECAFDDSALSFRCSLSIGTEHFAILKDVSPVKDTFQTGDSLDLNHLILQRLPADAEAKCAANPNCEYTTYLKLKVLNQRNEIVFPRGSTQDIIPLIAVSDTITQVAPRAIITKDMFGGPPKWGTVSISGTIAISDMVIGPTITSDGYYIFKITKDGAKYGLCPVTVSNEAIDWTADKLKTAAASCQTGTAMPSDKKISLAGDSYFTAGTITVPAGKTEASMGLKVLKYSADTASCTSDVVKWKVISTLLGTETSEGVVRPSGQPVVYNGQPQEKTTEINVRCNPFVAGAGGTQALASLITTSGSSAAGQTRTVTVRFTGYVTSDIIKSMLKLRVTKTGMVVYDGMPTVGTFTSTNEPAHEYGATLKLDHDAGTYQICAGAVCSDTFEVTAAAVQTQGQVQGQQLVAPINILGFGFSQQPSSPAGPPYTWAVKSGNSLLSCNHYITDCKEGLNYKYIGEDAGYVHWQQSGGNAVTKELYVRKKDCQIFLDNKQESGGTPIITDGQTSELARLAYAVYVSQKCAVGSS